MKNLIFLFSILYLSILPVYSINWSEVTAKNGSSAYIDLDSLKEYDNYYFYNIKVLNTYKNQDVVITIQNKKHSGLSARINYYTPEEYENLNGNYSNITDKKTENLELVQYGSLVSQCNKTVNDIFSQKQIQIQF